MRKLREDVTVLDRSEHSRVNLWVDVVLSWSNIQRIDSGVLHGVAEPFLQGREVSGTSDWTCTRGAACETRHCGRKYVKAVRTRMHAGAGAEVPLLVRPR